MLFLLSILIIPKLSLITQIRIFTDLGNINYTKNSYTMLKQQFVRNHTRRFLKIFWRIPNYGVLSQQHIKNKIINLPESLEFFNKALL